MDQLTVALQARREAYQSVYDKFKLVVNLCEMDDEEIRNEAGKLVLAFPNDFTEVLADESIQFAAFSKLRSCLTPSEQAFMLYEEGIADTFPSMNVALRIFLSMMVTSCSGERSFSKLALIKNHMRSSMSHERLSALCLLDVESTFLRMMNFEDFIKRFANAKCRKQEFL